MSLSFPISAKISGAGPLTRAGHPRPACRVFNQIRSAGQGPAADEGVRPTNLSDIAHECMRHIVTAKRFVRITGLVEYALVQGIEWLAPA